MSKTFSWILLKRSVLCVEFLFDIVVCSGVLNKINKKEEALPRQLTVGATLTIILFSLLFFFLAYFKFVVQQKSDRGSMADVYFNCTNIM